MPDLLSQLSRTGAVLLDTASPADDAPKTLLFTNPMRLLVARRPEEVQPLLEDVDRAVEQGCFAAGYLGYEAGAAFLPVPPRATEGPLAWFGIYDALEALPPDACDAVFAGIGHEASLAGAPTFSYAADDYLRRVARAKYHIAEGDVYQINLTGVFRFRYEGAPIALYAALRQRQRVPYAAYINTGEQHVLSVSPELFFQREGSVIHAEPMKGTVRRGRNSEEDKQLADWLAADEKSRAENLMIVDLLRNDLSIVCRSGTVHVPELFRTARYETLIQMTSTVTGELRVGAGYADIFPALFPCGSVTGAPKIRAMQLIQEIEPEPRGVYCGAIGYVAPGGQAVFNVAIRTLVLRDGEARMGVGSGIVADSDPQAEYRECLLKARFLTDFARDGARPEANAFSLIETMRWEHGRIRLLNLHVERLLSSADFFCIPLEAGVVRAKIQEVICTLRGGPQKVRLTADGEGCMEIAIADVSVPGEGIGRLKLSAVAVHSDNPFRYHKTTRRAMYDAEYRAALAEGYTEVLFLNERGEVAEGSRTNLFVRIGGELLTPPVASGLLPGVYRRHVLETNPAAREQYLFPGDLRRADAIFVCNAVWGMVEVKLDLA